MTQAPQTEAAIETCMRRFPSLNSARFYEEVHQDLAPLCRSFEPMAARYAWMRDPKNARHPAWDVITSVDTTAEQMDAAIDAARKSA